MTDLSSHSLVSPRTRNTARPSGLVLGGLLLLLWTPFGCTTPEVLQDRDDGDVAAPDGGPGSGRTEDGSSAIECDCPENARCAEGRCVTGALRIVSVLEHGPNVSLVGPTWVGSKLYLGANVFASERLRVDGAEFGANANAGYFRMDAENGLEEWTDLPQEIVTTLSTAELGGRFCFHHVFGSAFDFGGALVLDRATNSGEALTCMDERSPEWSRQFLCGSATLRDQRSGRALFSLRRRDEDKCVGVPAAYAFVGEPTPIWTARERVLGKLSSEGKTLITRSTTPGQPDRVLDWEFTTRGLAAAFAVVGEGGELIGHHLNDMGADANVIVESSGVGSSYGWVALRYQAVNEVTVDGQSLQAGESLRRLAKVALANAAIIEEVDVARLLPADWPGKVAQVLATGNDELIMFAPGAKGHLQIAGFRPGDSGAWTREIRADQVTMVGDAALSDDDRVAFIAEVTGDVYLDEILVTNATTPVRLLVLLEERPR